MMHAGPFVLYHLAQIRQQELDRRARTAWHREPAAAARARPSREPAATSAARLDAVAPGC
jgi:hypothetical protein